MNVSVDQRLCRPAARLFPRLEEATAIPMGNSLCAVFVDRPEARQGRLQADQDGLPVERPFITAELALRSGGIRHVLFLPQGIEALLSRRLVLRLDATPVAEIDPNWLQLPQAEVPALAAGLAAPGLRRLFRVMLTTGASLFAGTAQAGLADAILRLMDICDVPTVAPVAGTMIDGRVLVSYSAPGLSALPAPLEAVALADGRLVRIKDFDCFAEGRLLHVLFPPGIGPVQLVAFADAPLHLARPGAALRQLRVSDWLRARGKPCRDWLCVRLGRDGFVSPDSSAAPSEAKVTIRHLSAVPSGVLHALVLEDPSRVVRKLVLERQGRSVELTPLHGADGTALVTGLADLPGRAQTGEACRIRLLHHSGRLQGLPDAPLKSYDGAIPAGFHDAWAMGMDVLRPLARARAGVHRAAPPLTMQVFGPERKCKLRIVTSIDNSADLIRARAAMILAEGPGIPVEVVCTMTDGPLAMAARHALAQTAAIYGIPHRLVLMPGLATGSERVRAALVAADDVPALVLGADILPDGRGWLPFWLRRLRMRDALAPAVLAADGSIAASREGDDPCRGLPAVHLPLSGRNAPRPLANCLAVGPGGIARLLEGAPHPEPALWIASALGNIARTETRFPFRRFGVAAAIDPFAAALAEAGFAMIEKAGQ